jgi:2,4-dienoyl-CoA reductase-like NADH-dependent reductase (Old Yellow Enzyme family)
MSVDSESSQKTSLAALFTPYALNGLMLPNRLVMAPMTRGFATAGVPSENAVSYYARRAGMGLILTEGVAPDLIGSPETTVPNMFGAEALSVWARIVSAVHASGGRIMAQLWHTGLRRKVAKSFDPSQPSLGPSDYYPELDPARRNEPNRAVSGRAMSQQDIDATIRSYASAAKAARDLGFDGVELHGAHGYMLDQFFWAECNRRNDRYGGSLGNRVRLATEIISEIKRVAGRDFPVGLRFSQWKLPDFYDARMFESPKELEEFLTPFVDVGTDFFHASTRRYWGRRLSIQPSHAGWMDSQDYCHNHNSGGVRRTERPDGGNGDRDRGCDAGQCGAPLPVGGGGRIRPGRRRSSCSCRRPMGGKSPQRELFDHQPIHCRCIGSADLKLISTSAV